MTIAIYSNGRRHTKQMQMFKHLQQANAILLDKLNSQRI